MVFPAETDCLPLARSMAVKDTVKDAVFDVEITATSTDAVAADGT